MCFHWDAVQRWDKWAATKEYWLPKNKVLQATDHNSPRNLKSAIDCDTRQPTTMKTPSLLRLLKGGLPELRSSAKEASEPRWSQILFNCLFLVSAKLKDSLMTNSRKSGVFRTQLSPIDFEVRFFARHSVEKFMMELSLGIYHTFEISC